MLTAWGYRGRVHSSRHEGRSKGALVSEQQSAGVGAAAGAARPGAATYRGFAIVERAIFELHCNAFV